MHDASSRRALLSVHDKTGLVDLGKGLKKLQFEILASGGTAQALVAAGVPVTAVETFTGSPEVLGGRVKTLHPRIHAGILADRRQPEHLTDLKNNGFATIDLVVCNLYPFAAKLAAGASHTTLVETIDIGGPTLLRAAAKNADGGVAVLCNPQRYGTLLEHLSAGTMPLQIRRELAAEVFRHVATYDALIATWAETAAGVSPQGTPAFTLAQSLRYGENPHQQGFLFREAGVSNGIAYASQLAGKELSYNNYLDLDAAYRAAWTTRPTARCAIVKHTNPCGLAESDTQDDAFRHALAGDPVSAFGGIIGFNQPLTARAAQAILDAKLFVECIAAPGFEEDARAMLQRKADLRLVSVPHGSPEPNQHMHRIGGGVLVQSADPGIADPASWRVVTERKPAPHWLPELAFALDAGRLLKSNAIAISRGRALLGTGMGQTNRVDACRQAIERAGERVRGAFLASDAFFPFPDCVELAAQAGIAAIVQPGGSKRDQESIDACNRHGLVMAFCERRHFRH